MAAMNRPVLCLIAAVARNRAIGLQDQLLWRDPDDMKHFRSTTLSHPVLMGRKTWESLPARFRPLPGRRNLVLTRDATWRAEGAETVGSLEGALARVAGTEKLFVIGGAQVYALALPHADELELTEIDADLPGDTFFPDWDRSRFALRSVEARTSAAGVAYRFASYVALRA
jgi:dihydrofolate reductase